MSGIKQKYNVYIVEHLDYGDGHTETTRKLAGTTWAVSKERAECNVAYRQNGGRTWSHADWYGDGGRDTYYEAVLADDDT